MGQFAIFMHEDDHAWSRLPKTEQDRLMDLYLAWVGELRRNGSFVGGQPLAAGGRRLRRVDADIVETPFDDAKQVETGWFLVEAADLAAATKIARTCPALLHGETVVVRPVGHG